MSVQTSVAGNMAYSDHFLFVSDLRTTVTAFAFAADGADSPQTALLRLSRT
jgi:hypothetical protein